MCFAGAGISKIAQSTFYLGRSFCGLLYWFQRIDSPMAAWFLAIPGKLEIFRDNKLN